MKVFTPDDLLKKWPGKYESWKFSLSGKGEWVGSNGRITGKIISIKDSNNKEVPDIELRSTQSTGGFGFNIWSQAMKSFGKKVNISGLDNQSDSSEGLKTCTQCKRQYSATITKCRYCGLPLK